MARDFESFIVDPSLLDPSIDATNLRTTTDTNISRLHGRCWWWWRWI